MPDRSGIRLAALGPVAWLALAGSLAAVLVRYATVASASYTFNEATYVELAAHPWRSSFYPDTVFLRHPPLGLLVLAAWRLAFGDAEWVMRLPGLLFSLAAVVLGWAAGLRFGPGAAATVALVLGFGFLTGYGLEATMYPLAFAWGTLLVWGRLGERPRAASIAAVGLALTHLFGFIFLAAPVLLRPRDWKDQAGRAWLPWAWLVGATLMALVVNQEGDIMRWGPLGQFLRSGGTAGDAVAVRPWVHLASGAFAVFCLGPTLLAGVRRTPWRDWTLALAILVAFLFLGSPYPRYALLALPFVAVAGVAGWMENPSSRTTHRALLGLAVVLALASLPLASLYLSEGPDPRARGDVPGLQDWSAAVAGLQPGDATVATAGPTATAYYLLRDGWTVTDRGNAPYEIPLRRDDGALRILRLDAPQDLAGTADVWLVPDHWDAGALPDAARLCGHVTGLDVWAEDCATAWRGTA